MGGILLALIAAMEIQIPGTCPRLADVQQHLTPLLAPGFDARTQDRALVAEGSDGGVTVMLARADGGGTATRQLPRAGSCEAQAETIAVLLASWEGEIHPELSLRAATSTLSAGTPRGAGTPALAVATRATAPSSSGRGLAIEAIGIGVGGAWSPDSLAPSARIDLSIGNGASGWLGRLSLEAAGEQTVNVTPGHGDWWRAALALGGDYGARLGQRWVARAGVAGILGFVTVGGSGYSRDQRSTSLDAGAEALARIEWRRGRIAPWFGVALLARLRRQYVDVGGTTGSATLPLLEPSLALGADFRWER
jgi:hypothetical protein